MNFPDKGFDMDILLLDSNNEVESYSSIEVLKVFRQNPSQDARPPSILDATPLGY